MPQAWVDLRAKGGRPRKLREAGRTRNAQSPPMSRSSPRNPAMPGNPRQKRPRCGNGQHRRNPPRSPTHSQSQSCKGIICGNDPLKAEQSGKRREYAKVAQTRLNRATSFVPHAWRGNGSTTHTRPPEESPTDTTGRVTIDQDDPFRCSPPVRAC